MKIVERREHAGTWWGRAKDGSWHRWSTATHGWEGPLTPPWPPDHPDEAAIVAAAMASGRPPDGPPMNRVDAWWNRHFPPFSTRRLVFGLAALPVIGGLQELLWIGAGRDPSWPRYLFVCVAGGALLATAWLPGMREMAERLQRARGTSRSPWPWRREPIQEPPPPVETHVGRDFAVALPFAFVIVLVVTLTAGGPAQAFAPASLLVNAGAAAFTAAIIALRSSIWGLLLFSIVGGALGGFMMVFLSAMTFSDPSGDFVLGWIFGSLVLFAYGYPMWRGLRNLEARGFRLPMWIVMGGSVLLVSGAALVFVAEH